MLSVLTRSSRLRPRNRAGALLALLALAGGLLSVSPAFAQSWCPSAGCPPNPDPQPNPNSIPLSYNGDGTGANPVVCPMGAPGVTQNCTGQITVKAQPFSVGYVSWGMSGVPVVTGTNGSTFTYGTADPFTCHAVPDNPNGAEPGAGYCTLTHIQFTPGPASTGAQETMTVAFNWVEQGPGTETGAVFYIAQNPRLTGTDAISITTEGRAPGGTAVLSPADGSTLSCPPTTVFGDSACGAITVTAQGGPVKLGSPFFNDTDQYTNFQPDGTGTCFDGKVLAAGASCITDNLHFAPLSDGAFFDVMTFSFANGGGSQTITALGIVGAVSNEPILSPATLTCPATAVGHTVNCGTITLTNVSTADTYGIIESISDSTNFTIDPGTCISSNRLTGSQSCQTGQVRFTPAATGAFSAQVSFFSTWGNSAIPVQVNATSSNAAGTLSLSPANSLDCGKVGVGLSALCSNQARGTALTVTAIGGPVTLSTIAAQPAGTFSIDPGTCTPGAVIAQDASCVTGAVTFSAAAAQLYAGVLTFTDTQNNITTAQLNGQGIYGILTLSTTTIDCGSVAMGFTSPCNNGTGIILKATGGPVLLDSTTPITAYPSDSFNIDPGTCTPGTLLAAGITCTTGAITFSPAAAQGYTGSVPVTDAQNASMSVTLTGTGILGWVTGPTGACTGGSGQWNYSEFSAATCDSPTQTRTGSCTVLANSGTQPQSAFCTGTGGTLLDDSVCSQWAPKPAAKQSCTPVGDSVCGVEAPLTQTAPPASCVYTWNQAGFGDCTSAAPGTWTYSDWSPTSGCALVTQTRTGTCTAGVGIQTQAVTCQSADGTVQADALCASAGAKPALSQSCTVTTPGTNCGAEATLTQSQTLSNACGGTTTGGGTPPVNGPVTGPSAPGGPGGDGATTGYSWSSCTWGTCSGGTGSWSSSSWTPAAGSNCSETLHQTRTNTCLANSGSGTQACTATCQDSAGNPAPSSMCGSLPGGQTCTPTTVACTGTAPAVAQTVIDRSSCGPPTWVQSGFGACIGGSGTWSYAAWSPATGCGLVTQTSTGICTPAAGSGTQSQTVTCQATDGAVLPDSSCAGAAVRTQSCTPDASICDPAGQTATRQQPLTDCTVHTTGSGPCATDPAQSQFCVIVPLPPQ